MSKLSRDDNGQVCNFGRIGISQVITVGATSSQSNAVATNCTIVRLANSSTAPAFFTIGSNPTATLTTSAMMPANTVEYFEVTGGDKIALIRGALATDVSITQIA